MIEQVFEPFVTTKTRGTDLGLSIARRLTTLQGGLVTVSDRDGGGTVASLKLPLADRGLVRKPLNHQRLRGRFLTHREAELLDPIANLIAIEAQERCRPGLFPATSAKRLHHEASFELLQVDTCWR
jgi:Histidine kinase-, DNA gyrase B-, and HSP90-like ATPase